MVRPKHFPSPFHPLNPQVVVMERLWFAPDVKENTFVFPGFEDPDFFGRKAPVYIEYCSGNGLWVAEKAKLDPSANWIGVEKKYLRIRKIWSKIQNEKIDNLIGVCGEALSWTRRFVPDSSVDKVFINFPDPWPKNKHAKNRLLTAPFIQELGRILARGGELIVVTDHIPYGLTVLKLLLASPDFSPKAPSPHYLTEMEGYGSSYFEELWRTQGLDIHYLPFVRK